MINNDLFLRKGIPAAYILFKSGTSDEKTRTIEFFFENNYILTKTIQHYFGPISSKTYEYKCNTQGIRDTIIRQEFNEDGGFYEHSETYLTYSLINGGNAADMCSYEIKRLLRYFDINGEAIKESNGPQYRVKENGVWSEWKYYQL